MKLSILMPVYNEASTVTATVERVLRTPMPCPFELVIVDDGSADTTAECLAALDDPRVVTHRHAVNQGKGAAIRTAAGIATGDYIVICDADLEYAPEEIPSLLAPVLAGQAVVVFGSRSFRSHTAYSFWYVVGNKAVTLAANVLFNAWISDLETGFKLMPLSLYRELDVRSASFGMEAEVTAKLLARRTRIYEVPISYHARTRAEGKKLTWWDGVKALAIIARIRLAPGSARNRSTDHQPPGAGPGPGAGRHDHGPAPTRAVAP